MTKVLGEYFTKIRYDINFALGKRRLMLLSFQYATHKNVSYPSVSVHETETLGLYLRNELVQSHRLLQ